MFILLKVVPEPHTKIGKVPAFLFYANSRVWDLKAQQNQTVKILEAKPSYSAPKVKVLSFIPRDIIATSPLEDPEKGDDYDW